MKYSLQNKNKSAYLPFKSCKYPSLSREKLHRRLQGCTTNISTSIFYGRSINRIMSKKMISVSNRKQLRKHLLPSPSQRKSIYHPWYTHDKKPGMTIPRTTHTILCTPTHTPVYGARGECPRAYYSACGKPRPESERSSCEPIAGACLQDNNGQQ